MIPLIYREYMTISTTIPRCDGVCWIKNNGNIFFMMYSTSNIKKIMQMIGEEYLNTGERDSLMSISIRLCTNKDETCKNIIINRKRSCLIEAFFIVAFQFCFCKNGEYKSITQDKRFFTCPVHIDTKFNFSVAGYI